MGTKLTKARVLTHHLCHRVRVGVVNGLHNDGLAVGLPVDVLELVAVRRAQVDLLVNLAVHLVVTADPVVGREGEEHCPAVFEELWQFRLRSHIGYSTSPKRLIRALQIMRKERTLPCKCRKSIQLNTVTFKVQLKILEYCHWEINLTPSVHSHRNTSSNGWLQCINMTDYALPMKYMTKQMLKIS